jgi:hypothetical protein
MLFPIHINDEPMPPWHRFHIARIAKVYRSRTDARRRLQELREERESSCLSPCADTTPRGRR